MRSTCRLLIPRMMIMVNLYALHRRLEKFHTSVQVPQTYINEHESCKLVTSELNSLTWTVQSRLRQRCRHRYWREWRKLCRIFQGIDWFLTFLQTRLWTLTYRNNQNEVQANGNPPMRVVLPAWQTMQRSHGRGILCMPRCHRAVRPSPFTANGPVRFQTWNESISAFLCLCTCDVVTT